MPDYRGTVREVAWQEIFPWTLLVRSLRLAIDPRKLLLAAAGLFLTAAGWWLIALLFTGLDTSAESPRLSAYLPVAHGAASPRPAGFSVSLPWQSAKTAFEANALWISAPFRALLHRSANTAEWTAAFCSALWALAVWAWIGGAITRIAAVELGLDERLGLRSALAHAWAKWPAYFAAPLMPLVLVLLLCAPLALLGLLIWLFDAGVLLAGLAWPLVLLAGVVMAVVLFGLTLGWPLMWATISVDATDSFDAVSRSYSYVYQRPLHYLFYGVISLLLGMLGWIVAVTLAAGVLYLSHWGVSWGSGEARLAQVEHAAVSESAPLKVRPRTIETGGGESDALSAPGQWGAALIDFWDDCVRLLAVAFGYSFFWTAATAMYLLLRRDADATETDEVYIEGREDDRGLPPLKTDEAGVAVLADDFTGEGAAPPADNVESTAPPSPDATDAGGETP